MEPVIRFEQVIIATEPSGLSGGVVEYVVYEPMVRNGCFPRWSHSVWRSFDEVGSMFFGALYSRDLKEHRPDIDAMESGTKTRFEACIQWRASLVQESADIILRAIPSLKDSHYLITDSGIQVS